MQINRISLILLVYSKYKTEIKLKLLLTLSFLFVFKLSISQINSIDDLKKYYNDQGIASDSCLMRIFNQQGHGFDQIILIRHGKPLLSKEGLFSSYMAQEYIRNYDLVKVQEFNQLPVCIDQIEVDTIFSSDLERARNTAEQIIGERDIELISNRIFREFELEIFPVPFFHLPLNFWLVTARLMWFANLSTIHIEGKKASNHRISYVAQELERTSTRNEPLILVAHGLFNKRLSKELHKREWNQVYENGMGYLSIRILAKKSD